MKDSKDISNEFDAENKPQLPKNWSLSVLNNSPDIIYRFNIQTGRFEYISPTIRLLGFEP